MSIEVTGTGISLTDVASQKVASLLAQEGRDDLYLRVAVQPGGCSGLRYQLYFDDRAMDDDIERSFGTVKVKVDKMSDPYLAGAREAPGFTTASLRLRVGRPLPEVPEFCDCVMGIF